jgi:acetate kinase
MKILIANVGSTSFKYKLFNMKDESILSEGKIEKIGYDQSLFRFLGNQEKAGECEKLTYTKAVEFAIDFLIDNDSGVLESLSDLSAIGFKTVHAKGIQECRILDDDAISAMEEYIFLAPAHNPPYINAIRIFAELVPTIPLVGLFEPAFHRNIPDYAFMYGIPYEWYEKHDIRKYGFHGASHRWVSQRAPELVGMQKDNVRIISCHLGGSSSICAIHNGESIDTSMGFSPQSGLLNAKRCGDLDPFIPLYIQKKEGLNHDQVADALNNSSGLFGISGVSGDMRDIVKSASEGNNRARLAMDTFCYGVKKYIGSYFVSLGGLDILAFTGGIGEHGNVIRAMICNGLECLGVDLDNTRNQASTTDDVISKPDSKVKVVVVSANEELVVAREVLKLLSD